MDIVKAYDTVDHHYLVAQAKQHGFDLNILRWLLAVYVLPRLLVVEGVAAKPMCATRSMVPGDSNADVLMTLTILTTIDAAV